MTTTLKISIVLLLVGAAGCVDAETRSQRLQYVTECPGVAPDTVVADRSGADLTNSGRFNVFGTRPSGDTVRVIYAADCKVRMTLLPARQPEGGK